MRIGINAFPLRADAGGARYVFTGLLSALLRLEKDHRYVILAHFESLPIIFRVLHACGEMPVGPDPRVRVVQVHDEGHMYAFRDDFELYFAPLNNLSPRIYDRPTVAILHDIQEQYFPEYFTKEELQGRKEAYPEICRCATELIAISEFCKQSFIEKFEIEPEKIEVVYNTPQAQLVDRTDDGAWHHDPLPERFLYYPANCYPHKNHKRLLDALEKLKAEGTCPPMVFTGWELLNGFPLREQIKARGLSAFCHAFTDLSVDEIRYLYRHALALVMPTKFEGFGMPAVEAAACGCPVVCSDLPALREVMGDNALYFNPDDAADIAAKIKRISSDGELRVSLIEAGHGAAARFGWDSSARRLLDVFQKARDRFYWGSHAPNSVRRPRIGILLRLNANGIRLGTTIESLFMTGYPDVVVFAAVPATVKKEARQILKSGGVRCVEVPDFPEDNWAGIEQLIASYNPDLIVTLTEGNRLKRTALDSFSWGSFAAPDKPILLGESMDWKAGAFLGIARLRVVADELWRIDAYLYPELFCVNVRALKTWQEGRDLAAASGSQWRWEMLRIGRQTNRVFVLRRTVADTDRGTISPVAAQQAARAGMMQYQSANGKITWRGRAMRVGEPVFKAAAKSLPMKWQAAGTRIWYRIVR